MGKIASMATGLIGGGGGGGVPRTQNVSGNIANANANFASATDKGNQTFEAAKGLNANATQTLNNVVGQELPAVAAANKYAGQNYDTYSNTFAPLQAQQAQEAKDYTSGENIDMLRGRAVADSNAAQQAGRRNAQMALAAEGVDPASIHGGALDRQAAITGAAQNAGAANNSYLQAMDTGRALVNQANQLGLQVGGQALAGGQAGSGIASNLVNSQTGANEGQVNNLKGADTYLNTATGANNSAADIAHQQNVDEAAARAEASSNQGGLGGALGGAFGGVSSLLTGGAAGSTGKILSGLSSAAPLLAMMEKGGPVPQKGALPYAPVPGSTDTVPMLATPGEFVIPKDVVAHKGNEFFHKLIDSTRLKANERTAIPKPVFAHQSNH